MNSLPIDARELVGVALRQPGVVDEHCIFVVGLLRLPCPVERAGDHRPPVHDEDFVVHQSTVAVLAQVHSRTLEHWHGRAGDAHIALLNHAAHPDPPPAGHDEGVCDRLRGEGIGQKVDRMARLVQGVDDLPGHVGVGREGGRNAVVRDADERVLE
jgi:hypothetical protein